MSHYLVPAVVLAGGKASPAFARAAGVEYKALAKVRDDRPMVLHVLDALRNCSHVRDARIVAPESVAAHCPEVPWVPDTGSFLGNLTAGIATCQDAPQALVITCDVPFVTAAALDTFIELAVARDIDLAYPIVPLHLCLARYPHMRRTSIRLREGRFTGGNVVLVRPAFLLRNTAAIEEAYAARKQPLRLARMVGWDLVPRILLASLFPAVLPLALAEQRVGRLVSGKVAAIPLPYPEIGTDIDRGEDLAALKRQP